MIPPHVEEIEKQLKKIDHQMFKLRKKREAILDSDQDYSSYLSSLAIYCPENDPLPIRQFYIFMDEIEAINKELNDAYRNGDDAEELWRKHASRLRELEHLLAI